MDILSGILGAFKIAKENSYSKSDTAKNSASIALIQVKVALCEEASDDEQRPLFEPPRLGHDIGLNHADLLASRLLTLFSEIEAYWRIGFRIAMQDERYRNEIYAKLLEAEQIIQSIRTCLECKTTRVEAREDRKKISDLLDRAQSAQAVISHQKDEIKKGAARPSQNALHNLLSAVHIFQATSIIRRQRIEYRKARMLNLANHLAYNASLEEAFARFKLRSILGKVAVLALTIILLLPWYAIAVKNGILPPPGWLPDHLDLYWQHFLQFLDQF